MLTFNNTMAFEDPIHEIARELGLAVKSDQSSLDKQALVEKINELLVADFPKMVSILYRLDINESKLRSILKENPGTDAGIIIANLMIERQEEKARSRQQYKSKNDSIDENEKW